LYRKNSKSFNENQELNLMQKQTIIIPIPRKPSFAQREAYINVEIDKIQRDLISKGFKPISFEVNSKTDQRASVTFYFQK